MSQAAPMPGDVNADKAVYSGMAVVIVNSYVNPVSQRATKPVKKLPSNSDAEIKYLKWCCLFQNLGFGVVGGFCMNYAGMEQLVSNLQKMDSQKFASLVFLIFGYSRKGKFVCEDGLKFDLEKFYNAFSVNPISPWHNKPKGYLMDTFDIPRSWFSRLFNETRIIPLPPRHALKDKLVKRSNVYLLISRNVPYIHALSPGLICNDKLSNLFFREASTMGCKIFDKLHHLASEIELLNSSRGPRTDSSPIRPLPGSGNIVGNGFTIRDYCDGKFLTQINKPTKNASTKPKLNQMIADEDQPWFHGMLTTRRAEDRLIKDGDWLVRLSPSFETYGMVFLSLLQRNYCYHLPIRRSHGLYELGREAKTKLSQLLSQYCDRNVPIHSHNSDLYLRAYKPLPPSELTENFLGQGEEFEYRILDNLINPEVEIINQPWFYGWVGTDQIEPLLREEGAFVTRQTPTDGSHWGNFVITSFSRGQIYHTHVHLSINGQVYINRGELYPTVPHLVAYHFNAQKPIPTTQSEVTVMLRSYVINPQYTDPMSLPYKELKFPRRS